MRFIITVIWSLLIGSAISYILSAMGGQELTLLQMSIMAGILSIAVFVLGEGVLKEEKDA